MRKRTSAEDIRRLASRLREIAENTVMQDYARLMTRAAQELEHRAAQVESPVRKSGAHALAGNLATVPNVGSA